MTTIRDIMISFAARRFALSFYKGDLEIARLWFVLLVRLYMGKR